MPPPKKLVSDSSATENLVIGLAQRKPGSKAEGPHGNGGPAVAKKKPMLPQAGGRSSLSQRFSGSDGFSQGRREAHVNGEKSEVADRTELKSGGGTVSAALNLFKSRGEKPQTPPHKPTSLSNNLVEKSSVTRTHSGENGPRKVLTNALSSDDKSSPHHQSSSRQRARADSVGKAGHSVAKQESGLPSSAGGSPKRSKVKKDGSPSMSPPAPPLQNTAVSGMSDYENMELGQFSMGPAPPTTVPVPAILTRMDSDKRDSVDRSDSDADVYENVCIGFAGPPKDLTGPMPPLPPPKESGKPAAQNYENVKFLKSSDRLGGRRLEKSLSVEEDDDTLFGEEGPPGMQENIYENFGPDKGNRQMNLKDMAAHVEKLGKNGLATEYCRIRNEPISGPHTACRLAGGQLTVYLITCTHTHIHIHTTTTKCKVLRAPCLIFYEMISRKLKFF